MADWDRVRPERRTEGGRISFRNKATQMALFFFFFVMASTSFKVKIAFNMFNQYSKEKSRLSRGHTEIDDTWSCLLIFHALSLNPKPACWIPATELELNPYVVFVQILLTRYGGYRCKIIL